SPSSHCPPPPPTRVARLHRETRLAHRPTIPSELSSRLCRTMHKVTSAARYGVDKMTPFSPFRSNTADMATYHNRPSIKPPQVSNPNVTLSFNVPFNHRLAGPKPEDIIYATPGAFARWTHPQDPSRQEPPEIHDLPIHRQNVAQLQALLQQMEMQSGVSTF